MTDAPRQRRLTPHLTAHQWQKAAIAWHSLISRPNKLGPRQARLTRIPCCIIATPVRFSAMVVIPADACGIEATNARRAWGRIHRGPVAPRACRSCKRDAVMVRSQPG